MKFNIERAIHIYYTCTEIGSPEIKEIFGCSDSSVRKLKAQARELMVKKNASVWFGKNVNTKCAFEAWNLEISDLERRYTKLTKLFGCEHNIPNRYAPNAGGSV